MRIDPHADTLLSFQDMAHLIQSLFDYFPSNIFLMNVVYPSLHLGSKRPVSPSLSLRFPAFAR